MWKFLSALNLICIMFISGCTKNSNSFKKYDFLFPEISNSYLTIIRNFDSVTGIDISDVKNQLLPDIVVPNSDFEDFKYGFKYHDYNDFSTRIKVRDFYKSNATRVVKDNFPIVSYYEKYFIDKLVDVKITFSNQNYYQNWVITSFSAKMPH